MIDLTSHILGETNEHIEVDLREDLRQLILTMGQQAKHRILIFSHDLDHNLFDTEELYETIKNLAIKNPRTHIHILVQNAHPMHLPLLHPTK
jgi:ABC-type thiamine transport system ATPase subunit